MATTQLLTATPRNATGDPLTGRTITWSSANTAIATVDSSGLVTAVAPGSTTVTASTGGVTASVPVTVNPAVNPTFGLGLTNPNQSVARSGSTQFAVQVIRTNGYSGSITITSGSLPSGVTVGYATTANAVSPSSSITLSGGETTLYVTVSATGGAPLGPFALNVIGNGTGGKKSNVIFQVDVTSSASPSIALSPAATNVTLIRGTTSTYSFTLLRNGGYTGDVSLAFIPAFGLAQPGNIPVYITGSFSDNTLTGGESTSTLSVTLPSNLPAGNYQVGVQASGSGVTSTSALLNIVVTTS